MTADIELLPLYAELQGHPKIEIIKHYARAYAAHATAAKDTEIKALQEEVSGLRAARIAYASEFSATADGDPDTGNIHANIRALKAEIEALRADVEAWKASHSMLTDTCHHFQAKAERLAEALRELVEVFSESGMYDEEVFAKARAALDQEEGNG